MEGVWFKTEPADENVDDSFSIKMEHGTHINVEPITVIEEGESHNVLLEYQNPSEEIGTDRIQKSSSERYIEKGVKKSRNKIRQRKQPKKRNAAESDDEKVEKKSSVTRVKRSYICDECGKEFSGASGLNRHKLLHSGIKPYVCHEENCGAAFSQSSTLKSHQMSHTGERKFFCEECGQGFSSKFHMQIHQRCRHSGERPFVCTECGQGFTRKQGLTRHKLEHLGEKPFECDECGLRFYEKILLRSHKKTHTADGKPYTCTECGKGFFHNTSLNAHKRNHSIVPPFGCEICGKRFTQKGTLNIHKVTHSDVRPFGCEACGLRFTQKYTLKQHRLKQHGLTTAPLKPQKRVLTGLPVPEPTIVDHNIKISLSDCSTIRPSETVARGLTRQPIAGHNHKILRSSIRRSEISESNPTRKSILSLNRNELKEVTLGTESDIDAQDQEESSEIGKIEPSSSENEFMLESHDDESTEFEDKYVVDRSIVAQPHNEIATNFDQIKEETPSSEPLLAICKSEENSSDEEYVSKKSRKIEAAMKASCDQSVHLPFSCGKCERKFAMVGALKNHQRSHKRGKRRENSTFICDECGKIFAGKQHLKIHKRIHSGLTPYLCTVCNKSFTQLGNLKTHQFIHTGERPFACDICGMRFSKKNTVEKHKRTHTDVRAFECDVCGKKFKHSSSIKRHKMTHTGEKNFGCDICGKTFTEKSYIKFHLRTHTGFKPFACDQCPSTFIDNSQLTQHKGYSHRSAGEPSPYRRRKLMKMMKMMDNL